MGDGLRITGGEMRGRKLFSPPKDTIRPASDMIRQAVFNMLAPDISGVDFYDVFAGTGVVGLEALSRGAGKAILVERERRQIELIRRNARHLGVLDSCDVRLSDAFLWARHFRPTGGPCIVFLGPPYELFEDGEELDRTMELVERVQKSLRIGDILVLQFAREVPIDRLPNIADWYRLRHYGKTYIGLWTPEDPNAERVDIGDDDSTDEPVDDDSIDDDEQSS